MPKSKDPRFAIAILAAGKGTRLKSKHPKVLHQVGGKPLLAHVIATAMQIVPARDIYAIIGHEAERVREAVASSGVNFVNQSEQRGTGHALMVAADALAPYDHVLVLSGDAPLMTADTVARLRDFHLANNAAMTLLTAELENPTSYGRVLRKAAKSPDVKAIVEEKSATATQKKIREVNAGVYAFAVPALGKALPRLNANNTQGEYYLTDLAAVMAAARARVLAIKVKEAREVLGANTRAELMDIDRQMRRDKIAQLMAEGVSIFYPETCVIDVDVVVGADTTIEPFVQLLGKTRIGSDCRIRSYSVIQDSEIEDSALILPGCVLDESRVRAGAKLGPYSRLRPGSDIGEGAHVGNFVETKKMTLGKGSKANHLTYLGDAEIGEGVNIGAGTITCNYDGTNKFKTIIEDGVFVGSDSTLVAPVRLKRGSYVAAASCITEDVPEDALALARSRQIVKAGWAGEKRAAKAKQAGSK